MPGTMWIDLEDMMAQWNQPNIKGHILCDSTHRRSLESSDPQTQGRMVGERGWGGDRDRVSVWEDEKVLEVQGGDGCTALWMC
jgi:hypothetical protein